LADGSIPIVDSDENIDELLGRLEISKTTVERIESLDSDVSTGVSPSFQNEISQALKLHQFELYYQPQFSLQTGKVVGMEALVRWNHPDKGVLSAAHFIPQLEQSEMILLLDEWVLRQACQQCKNWLDEGYAINTMAINLSASLLQQKGFIAKMAQILLETRVPPEYIELEITEGVAMAQVERNIDTLNRLREMGLMLTIDDFGTGYSSLGYLKHFPVQKLKIDKTFIDDITTDSNDQILVKVMLDLARRLRLKLLVEGVETIQQAELLRGWGVDHVQGYLFSKPIHVMKMERLMSQSGLAFSTGRSLSSTG